MSGNPTNVLEKPLFIGENGLVKLDMIIDSEGNLTYDCDWASVAVQGTASNLAYRVFLFPIPPISDSDLTYTGGSGAPDAIDGSYNGTGTTRTFSIHAQPMMSTFDNGQAYFDIEVSSPVVVTDSTYGTGLAFYLRFVGEPTEATPIDATYYASVSFVVTSLCQIQEPTDSTSWTIPVNRHALTGSPYGLKQSYTSEQGAAMLTSGWSTNKGLKGNLQYLVPVNDTTGEYSATLQNIFTIPDGMDTMVDGNKDFNYANMLTAVASVNLDPTLSTDEFTPTGYYCNCFVDAANEQIGIFTCDSNGNLADIGDDDKIILTIYFKYKPSEVS